MKININGDLNPGCWFYFDDDKPEEGRVKLKIATPEKNTEFEKKTTKKSAVYKYGKRHETVETDSEKFNALLWDYCIEEWEGLIDAEGNNIECTSDNKTLLMGRCLWFAKRVGECLEKLTEDTSIIAQEMEKNSSRTL